MVKRSALRASDSDRDRVAERLRQAATEGRLLAHELEERLARTLRAKTYGELDDVVADLPGAARVPATSGPRKLAVKRPTVVTLVLIGAGVSIAALLAAAVAVVASGIWIAPLVLFLIFRAHTGRHGPPRRGPGPPPHVRVHAHRHGHRL